MEKEGKKEELQRSVELHLWTAFMWVKSYGRAVGGDSCTNKLKKGKYTKALEMELTW